MKKIITSPDTKTYNQYLDSFKASSLAEIEVKIGDISEVVIDLFLYHWDKKDIETLAKMYPKLDIMILTGRSFKLPGFQNTDGKTKYSLSQIFTDLKNMEFKEAWLKWQEHTDQFGLLLWQFEQSYLDKRNIRMVEEYEQTLQKKYLIPSEFLMCQFLWFLKLNFVRSN